jgi:hypothetical protein
MRLAELNTKIVNLLMDGALQFRRYEVLKIICCLILQSMVFCILKERSYFLQNMVIPENHNV